MPKGIVYTDPLPSEEKEGEKEEEKEEETYESMLDLLLSED